MLDILPARIAIIQEILGEWVTNVITVTVAFNSFKLKVVLGDGSSLRIEEHYSRGRIGRYSYYLLDVNDQLLVGWDNAPHHTHLANFPHQKHVGQQDNREPSYETTLDQVLSVVKQKLATN